MVSMAGQPLISSPVHRQAAGSVMAFLPLHLVFQGRGEGDKIFRSVLTGRCLRPYATVSSAAITHLACNCFRTTLIMFYFITRRQIHTGEGTRTHTQRKPDCVMVRESDCSKLQEPDSVHMPSEGTTLTVSTSA